MAHICCSGKSRRRGTTYSFRWFVTYFCCCEVIEKGFTWFKDPGDMLHLGGDGMAAGTGGGRSHGNGSQEAESKQVGQAIRTWVPCQWSVSPSASRSTTFSGNASWGPGVQTLKPQWHQQMLPRVLLHSLGCLQNHVLLRFQAPGNLPADVEKGFVACMSHLNEVYYGKSMG